MYRERSRLSLAPHVRRRERRRRRRAQGETSLSFCILKRRLGELVPRTESPLRRVKTESCDCPLRSALTTVLLFSKNN